MPTQPLTFLGALLDAFDPAPLRPQFAAVRQLLRSRGYDGRALDAALAAVAQGEVWETDSLADSDRGAVEGLLAGAGVEA
jgi:hypothetical protein